MLHTYVIALHGEQHCAGCLPFADTLATGHYMAHVYMYCTMLKKLVRLGCITQGSLAEITNERFSLKYQT